MTGSHHDNGDAIVPVEHRHEKAKKWALILSVFAFMISTGWNVVTRINVQQSNVASIDQVITTIEDACVNRHALTVQYRVRAQNQRVLAHALLLTTQAFLIALEESPPPPPDTTQQELEVRAKFIRQYKAAIPKVEHVLNTTKILPLENCRKQAAELRQEVPIG